MASVGPEIPAHLLNKRAKEDIDEDEATKEASESIGPQIPVHLLAGPSSSSGPAPPANPPPPGEEVDDDDDDDDYAPPLPPHLAAVRTQQPSTSKRPLGPTLPGREVREVRGPTLPAFDDDDDDYGPMPAAGGDVEETDGVREFIEREQRRKKAAEEASKPKALKRDEWMLVPPSSSDALGALADPLKLKARQFSRSANPKSKDNNLWTETPAERQQRIADEVSGKKRRAANAEPEIGDDEVKRRKRDEGIRAVINSHNRSARDQSLLNMHASASNGKKKEDDTQSAIWDHARDMSMGGRLMDEKQRGKLINDAKALGDRFGSSKGGSFL